MRVAEGTGIGRCLWLAPVARVEVGYTVKGMVPSADGKAKPTRKCGFRESDPRPISCLDSPWLRRCKFRTLEPRQIRSEKERIVRGAMRRRRLIDSLDRVVER